MTSDPDRAEDLRHRLREGDPDALGELLSHHWTPLVTYLAGIAGDRDIAEDLAQDAFVALWRVRATLHEGGSLEAFLYEIARNRARDYRRRRRTREAWGRVVGRVGRDPRPATDPAELSELQAAVARAIAALPARRREVFLLLRTTRLTHQEVAGLLGVAPQTVANLMSRALDDLRVALAPYLEPP
jgi:RNA polymerase sigma-70 factor (ECF subfamily)